MMHPFKLLLLLLGLHFFADFTLQGCLAQLKQKAWWDEQELPKGGMADYSQDWLCALICHSVYWTLVTFAPIIWLWKEPAAILGISLFVQAVFHAIIDNDKANRFKINLIEDQVCHILQIFALWAGFIWPS